MEISNKKLGVLLPSFLLIICAFILFSLVNILVLKSIVSDGQSFSAKSLLWNVAHAQGGGEGEGPGDDSCGNQGDSPNDVPSYIDDPFVDPTTGGGTPLCAVSNVGDTCSVSNSCGLSNTGTIQCDGVCATVTPVPSVIVDTRTMTPSKHYLGTWDDFRGGPASICTAVGKGQANGNYACAPNLNTDEQVYDPDGNPYVNEDGSPALRTNYYAESRHNGGWGIFLYGQNWCQETGVDWVECGSPPIITPVSAPPDSNCEVTTDTCPDGSAIPADGICPDTSTNICPNGATNYPTCTFTAQSCEAANICGATNSGTIVNGVCSVTAPANPAGYGESCTSSPNNCGDTSAGSIGCDGCSASAPADRNSCVPPPATCTLTNICGDANTGIIVNGVCSVTTPANPAGYGSFCTSSNNCGDTDTGRVGCSGCSALAPENRVCALQKIDGLCSVPATHYSCNVGTSANPSEASDSWAWDCIGINDGTTASCTENKFNGVCSDPSIHWNCKVGASKYNTGGASGPWSWTCQGLIGGRDASCSQSRGGGGGGGYCPDGSPIPPSGVCPGGGGGYCPDGSPIPPSGVCLGGGGSSVDGECAVPATFFRPCDKGTVARWNESDPAVRTWDCVGSGSGATTARCSQDVITLCVDRGVKLCSGNYSISRECGIERNRTLCPYGCLSGECQPPGSINLIQPLQVRPALVRRDSPTRVYWKVENAASCSVTGTNGDSWPNTFFSGVNGIQSKPIKGHTVFTLYCRPLSPLNGGPAFAPVTQTQTVDIAPIFQEL